MKQLKALNNPKGKNGRRKIQNTINQNSKSIKLDETTMTIQRDITRKVNIHVCPELTQI